MESFYYKLRLKNGMIENLNVSSETETIDEDLVKNRIRELMDDQYDVTEEIKEQAIKDLRNKLK